MATETASTAGIAEERRFEIKLAFHELELPWLQAAVRLHAEGFREEYPSRQVNSAYLDTPDLTCFHDNVEGFDDRDKVRLRWYGGADAGVPATLEVKRRRAGSNVKLRHPLAAGIDLEGGVTWPEVLRRVRERLPAGMLAAMGGAWTPVLINRYERDYYVTQDGRVRVTIDYRQRLFSQRASLRPNLTRALPPPSIAVLEVKAPYSERERLLAITSRMPARVSRNSKYALAAERALHA